MHIREPRDFEKVRSKRLVQHRVKRLRRWSLALIVLLVGIVLVGYGAYLRPYPALAAKSITPTISTDQVALSWPATGQSAIGAQGQGVMATTPTQQPVPIASVAKVMTALAVLKKHPLKPGAPGPTITMTDVDVARYTSYASQGGSVVKITEGEQLTEYQALQALMLPSANNIADSLAVWAYGSMSAYHTAANQLAQSLGMTQSTFDGDASGLLPNTVSTAKDLVLLGQAGMADPVFKEIVAQPSAPFPIVGTITNVNVLLGSNGIIGIKTGNTDEAGGCFLFAAERTLADGQKVTAVGANLGAQNLGRAMTSSLPLLDSFYQGFTMVNVLPKGTVVGHYAQPWDGTTVTAIAAQDTKVMNWRGSKTAVKVALNQLAAPQASGALAGAVTAKSSYGEAYTPVVLAAPITAPSWQWRITRH